MGQILDAGKRFDGGDVWADGSSGQGAALHDLVMGRQRHAELAQALAAAFGEVAIDCHLTAFLCEDEIW